MGLLGVELRQDQRGTPFYNSTPGNNEEIKELYMKAKLRSGILTIVFLVTAVPAGVALGALVNPVYQVTGNDATWTETASQG